MYIYVYLAGKAGSQRPTSRLTGLDPAGPVYYLSLSSSDMIYKGNGIFVDLYHTSRGMMGDSRTGTGDIDVYVNGGTTQPGCTSFEVVPGIYIYNYLSVCVSRCSCCINFLSSIYSRVLCSYVFLAGIQCINRSKRFVCLSLFHDQPTLGPNMLLPN